MQYRHAAHIVTLFSMSMDSSVTILRTADIELP